MKPASPAGAAWCGVPRSLFLALILTAATPMPAEAALVGDILQGVSSIVAQAGTAISGILGTLFGNPPATPPPATVTVQPPPGPDPLLERLDDRVKDLKGRLADRLERLEDRIDELDTLLEEATEERSKATKEDAAADTLVDARELAAEVKRALGKAVTVTVEEGLPAKDTEDTEDPADAEDAAD